MRTHPTVTKEVFSTCGVQAPQRLALFQNRFGAIWGPVSVKTHSANSFLANVESTNMCGLRFNRLTFQSLAFYRQPHDEGCTHFIALALPRRGEAHIHRGADVYAFRPGALYTVRHGKPDLTSIADHYTTDNIQIPLHLMESRSVRFPETACLPLDPGTCGRVLEHFIEGLWSELPYIRPDDEPVIVSQLCDLLARAIDRCRDASGVEAMGLRNQRERVLRQIGCLIADPALSPSIIADAAGMSVSHLHRVFASGGVSVMSEVRALRVCQASELLAARQHRHTQIAEIAYACGFASQQDFSRVFRQQCGMTPSQFRLANCEL